MRHTVLAALLLGGVASTLPGLHGHGSLSAQQFIVDDAGTVGAGACQVEGWVGQRNSWLLPACQLSRGPGVTLGIGAQAREEGGGDAAWVLQAKIPVRDPEHHAWGWGVVAGLGGDPLAQVTGRRPESVFAYLPLSVPSRAGLLHLNLGASLEPGRSGGGLALGAAWTPPPWP